MSMLDAARYRIAALRRALFDRAAWRADLDEEIRFHLELEAMHRRHGGASDAEARRAARRRFGRPERVRERLADATGVSALDGLRQDLRFAARTLRRAPGFTAVAVLTLALGIGGTTAIFSVVSAVLLRPLPYLDADRIVTLGEVTIGARPGAALTTSWPNFAEWQRGSRAFEAMAVYHNWGPALTGEGEPERVRGALVTAGIHDVLRVVPALGRPMLLRDNAPGSEAVVLLSDGFWRRRFGADPAVLGRAIMLNGRPQVVIGVLPRSFRGPNRALDGDVWGNNSFDAADGRSTRYLSALARLAPGATLESARAELRTVSRALAAAHPDDNAGLEATAVPLRDHVVGDARRSLLLLLGASALVLAVACANLSNLLIARGLARGREFALRAAIGAGRGRLVRQLLVESTAIAALGSVAGVALAAVAVRGVLRLAPDVVRAQPIAVDARVLGFTLVMLATTGLLAGLLPARHAAHADAQSTLKAGGRGVAGGTGLRARDTLAVAQLALALALVTGAGLLVKSLARLQRVDPGIAADGVLTMSMNLAAAKYPRGSESQMYDALLQRVAALPGVRDAAVTSTVPFDDNYDHVTVDVQGEPARRGADALDAERFIVSPGFFLTLGIALVAGRAIEASDAAGRPLVAMVDEVFARRIAPGRSAIGVRIAFGDEWRTVVGVVRNVRHAGLDAPSVGQAYVPVAQTSWRWVSLVVRAAPGVDARALVPSVRGAVRAIDPEQPVFAVNTVDALVRARGAPRRFVLVLLGAFAAAALALAAIGLYGVMAYAVAQRHRELGVRVSLGATPADVRRLVLGRGILLATWGGLLGVAASLGVARLLGGALYDVRPTDAGVFSAGAAVLVLAAAAASYAPARRAARTDPAVVLRGD